MEQAAQMIKKSYSITGSKQSESLIVKKQKQWYDNYWNFEDDSLSSAIENTVVNVYLRFEFMIIIFFIMSGPTSKKVDMTIIGTLRITVYWVL